MVLTDKKIANDNMCLIIQNDNYDIYFMFLMFCFFCCCFFFFVVFFFFFVFFFFCRGHYSKIDMYQLTMTQFVMRGVLYYM